VLVLSEKADFMGEKKVLRGWRLRRKKGVGDLNHIQKTDAETGKFGGWGGIATERRQEKVPGERTVDFTDGDFLGEKQQDFRNGGEF